MSESRSTSKSYDSFNQHVIENNMCDLFQDDDSTINPNYNPLHNLLQSWLSTINIPSMNEKALQLDFYYNCMKRYNPHIGETLKYGDDFKGTIYKNLFERLMPDFCVVNYCNPHIKSSSSGLDLEFLPIHIVSILELKKKLKDSDIGQLLHYLQIVLDYSPESRLFIIGAITDFHDIRFAKISRSANGDIKYEASLPAFIDEHDYLLHYLTRFLTVDASRLGYNNLVSLPNNILIHNKLLGIGANSMVFNCFIKNDPSYEYALKISNKSVDNEISIYKKLYADQYNIIKVHEYALLFLHPPGQVISKDNLLTNIHAIWFQIKNAHENNISHRDIRKCNILEIFNNQTKR